jgi:hypothetical protein
VAAAARCGGAVWRRATPTIAVRISTSICPGWALKNAVRAFLNVACDRRDVRCVPEIKHMGLCVTSSGHPWPEARLLKTAFQQLASGWLGTTRVVLPHVILLPVASPNEELHGGLIGALLETLGHFVISDYREAEPGPDLTDTFLGRVEQLERLEYDHGPDIVHATVSAGEKMLAHIRYFESLPLAPYPEATFAALADARGWIASNPRPAWRSASLAASAVTMPRV